jgi:hypothetical protein
MEDRSLAVALERLGVVAARIAAAAPKRAYPPARFTVSEPHTGQVMMLDTSAELMRPGLAAPELFTWANVAWTAG